MLKPVALIVLSLAGNAAAAGLSFGAGIPASVGTILAATVIFALAAFAPWALMYLLAADAESAYAAAGVRSAAGAAVSDRHGRSVRNAGGVRDLAEGEDSTRRRGWRGRGCPRLRWWRRARRRASRRMAAPPAAAHRAAMTRARPVAAGWTARCRSVARASAGAASARPPGSPPKTPLRRSRTARSTLPPIPPTRTVPVRRRPARRPLSRMDPRRRTGRRGVTGCRWSSVGRFLPSARRRRRRPGRAAEATGEQPPAAGRRCACRTGYGARRGCPTAAERRPQHAHARRRHRADDTPKRTEGEEEGGGVGG